MLNINGKNDSSYRYKMNPIKSSINGKGNGIFTILHNLNDISASLNHPDNLLLKFLSYYFGSIANEEKFSITGSYSELQLQEALQIYINRFVLCPFCSIPETTPVLRKETKKNILLDLKCYACGKTSEIKCNNKIEEKMKDLIIKYIEKYNWQISNKGNMVNSLSMNSLKSLSTNNLKSLSANTINSSSINSINSLSESFQIESNLEDGINLDEAINPFD